MRNKQGASSIEQIKKEVYNKVHIAAANRGYKKEEEKKATDSNEESIVNNLSNLWNDFWKPKPDLKLPTKQQKNDSFN